MYSRYGILLARKSLRQTIFTWYSMDEPQQHYAKGKKPGSKNTCCIIHLYEMPRKDKFTETKTKLVVGFLGRGVGMGIDCKLAPGKLLGDGYDQNFDNVCMTL